MARKPRWDPDQAPSTEVWRVKIGYNWPSEIGHTLYATPTGGERHQHSGSVGEQHSACDAEGTDGSCPGDGRHDRALDHGGAHGGVRLRVVTVERGDVHCFQRSVQRPD